MIPWDMKSTLKSYFVYLNIIHSIAFITQLLILANSFIQYTFFFSRPWGRKKVCTHSRNIYAKWIVHWGWIVLRSWFIFWYCNKPVRPSVSTNKVFTNLELLNSSFICMLYMYVIIVMSTEQFVSQLQGVLSWLYKLCFNPLRPTQK